MYFHELNLRLLNRQTQFLWERQNFCERTQKHLNLIFHFPSHIFFHHHVPGLDMIAQHLKCWFDLYEMLELNGWNDLSEVSHMIASPNNSI